MAASPYMAVVRQRGSDALRANVVTIVLNGREKGAKLRAIVGVRRCEMALSQVPVRFGKVFTLLSVALLGCAEVPVHDVTKSFAVEVREITESGGPIKLDFLWVIDNSSSMCQEQYALAKSFANFQTQLQTYLNIDIRLAVTTTDAVEMQGSLSIAQPASSCSVALRPSRWRAGPRTAVHLMSARQSMEPAGAVSR
jgi:hypothetical protein